MDALPSQALVAGYRAVIVAAERLPGFFPLLMTAAGTVPPTKVLVLIPGIAGLPAIATARRLGAVVSAYDVRAAAAEEIRSMGARFVELDLPSLEGSGGYAREMTDERSRLQRELLAPHVAEADALITTAAVPGREAPLLVTREMVAAMRPGSVVIDLAAESGGNVEGSVPGEEVRVQDVLVWGGLYRSQPDAGPRQPALCSQRRQPAPADDERRARRSRLRRRDRRRDVRDTRRRGAARGDSRPAGGDGVTEAIALLTVFVLAVFVGFEVVSKVSSTLHTPLMSGANAIHGVVLVGAIIVAGAADWRLAAGARAWWPWCSARSTSSAALS